MEFKKGQPVYFLQGMSTVRCEIYEVRKKTVRVITLCGQIITKKKEDIRVLPILEELI